MVNIFNPCVHHYPTWQNNWLPFLLLLHTLGTLQNTKKMLPPPSLNIFKHPVSQQCKMILLTLTD